MLSRALGGPRIFIKRDDLTGVALGGNKLRNLEFRLARTMAENPDTVIVGLDLQSNSARQTVGACNKLGLKTILVLEGHRPNTVQGNLLIDYLLGAEVHFAATRDEQRAMLDKLAAQVRAARRTTAYPQRQSDVRCRLGARLYRDDARGARAARREHGLAPTAFYMSSSGKGQAGIVLAQRLLAAGFTMEGVTATDEFHIPSRTAAIANETAAALDLDFRVTRRRDRQRRRFRRRAATASRARPANEAVRLFARTEGIVLDPIYTGKAAAGMIAHIREGRYRRRRRARVRPHRRHAGDLHLERSLARDAGAAAREPERRAQTREE